MWREPKKGEKVTFNAEFLSQHTTKVHSSRVLSRLVNRESEVNAIRPGICADWGGSKEDIIIELLCDGEFSDVQVNRHTGNLWDKPDGPQLFIIQGESGHTNRCLICGGSGFAGAIQFYCDNKQCQNYEAKQ
jgi:hypothetical protein